MVDCGFGFQGSAVVGPGGLPLNYGLFAQTGNNITITNTTTESTLIDTGVGTLNVPANGFKVGDSFQGQFMGLLSSLNNATLNIKLKSGSVVLATSNAQTLPAITSGIWMLTLDFTVRAIGGPGVASIVSFGTFYDIKQSNSQQQGFSFTTTNSITFDTTIANTLNVTAQWGAASTSNSIHPDIFVLNKIF
jgi:hypothetical protein